MYIRIEFENMESDATQSTRNTFFGTPNGMCLSSQNAHILSSNELRETYNHSVVFWDLDVDVLDKDWNGVMCSLVTISNYPGVKCVDVVPFEGKYDSYIDNLDELVSILMKSTA